MTETLHDRIYRALREADPVQGAGLPPWQKPRYDKMTDAVLAQLDREFVAKAGEVGSKTYSTVLATRHLIMKEN